MPTTPRMTLLAAAGAGAVCVWLWAELVDSRASRRSLGAESREGSPICVAASVRTDAVVVLGFGNRGERANFVNRFRVRAGIRSLDPAARPLLVLCGGGVRGDTPEAVIMQRYAPTELGYTGAIELDTESRSTWQNIVNALPFIEQADTVKIVSNAPHAEMGRDILHQLRPDLALRLVRGAEYRFGEAPLLKILGALRILLAHLTGSRVSRARPPR